MNWDLTPTLWQESFTDGAYTHCSPPFLQLTLLTGARNGNNGLELGTSDNCPLMSLTPSEKKLYQLYMSATSPMFSWNAKVHVEWNVRTLKLINLHLCMHDWLHIVWIESFFFISIGLWLFNNRVFHFILWLLVSAVHGGKIKSLLNLLWKKTTHYESDLYEGRPDSEQLHVWYRSGYILNQKHAYILNQVIAGMFCCTTYLRVCIRM